MRKSKSNPLQVSPIATNRRTTKPDRRTRIVQVQRERRKGVDRRVRNLHEELALMQRLRAAAQSAVEKYKSAIQQRVLGPATVQRYVRYIFQNTESIRTYDEEIRSIVKKLAALSARP